MFRVLIIFVFLSMFRTLVVASYLFLSRIYFNLFISSFFLLCFLFSLWLKAHWWTFFWHHRQAQHGPGPAKPGLFCSIPLSRTLAHAIAPAFLSLLHASIAPGNSAAVSFLPAYVERTNLLFPFFPWLVGSFLSASR